LWPSKILEIPPNPPPLWPPQNRLIYVPINSSWRQVSKYVIYISIDTWRQKVMILEASYSITQIFVYIADNGHLRKSDWLSFMNSSSCIVRQISLCSEGLTRAWCFFDSCRCPPRPNPSIQTIILDRACLGSILKGSRHSGGGQEACFQGFQKCTIFAQQTGPRTKSFRGRFPSPFFCFDGYG